MKYFRPAFETLVTSVVLVAVAAAVAVLVIEGQELVEEPAGIEFPE